MTDLDGKSPELNLDRMRQGGEGVGDFYEDTMTAIDAASDQDTITWVVYGGKRICAIVPVDVAEHHLGCLGEVLEYVNQVTSRHRTPCPECQSNPCKMDCSRR